MIITRNAVPLSVIRRETHHTSIRGHQKETMRHKKGRKSKPVICPCGEFD